MRIEDLLDLRQEASREAEERALQAIRDTRTSAQEAERDLGEAENRLAGLQALEGDEGVALLVRSEQVRRVSNLRARWCRARTALEEAELALDRVRYLRRRYQEEVRA